MATIREAFRGMLAGDGTITALVSDRISPIRNRTRSGQPSIAYQSIGANSPLHLGGRSNPQSMTFRVDCVSGIDEKQAATLAAAVKTLVDGYRGLQSGIFIEKISVTDASDSPSDPVSGDDVGVYCESLDVKILYKG